MKNKHAIYVRVVNRTKKYNFREIGKKIDDQFGNGTVSHCHHTISGHIVIFVTNKDLIATSDDWLPTIHADFTPLDITPWFKGVVYGVPEDMTPEQIAGEIEATSTNSIALHCDPKIIKTSSTGSTVILSFQNVEDYTACKNNGVLLRYQKLRMTAYTPKPTSKQELLTRRKRQYDPRQTNDDNNPGDNTQQTATRPERPETIPDRTTRTNRSTRHNPTRHPNLKCTKTVNQLMIRNILRHQGRAVSAASSNSDPTTASSASGSKNSHPERHLRR